MKDGAVQMKASEVTEPHIPSHQPLQTEGGVEEGARWEEGVDMQWKAAVW